MCGIIGVFGPRPVDETRLRAGMDTLAHRGPDGEGLWVDKGLGLGHKRLAILDVSDAGAQPMTRGDLTLIHNGEIYNYLELRAELEDLGHGFSTGTDTEVLIAAYAQWGKDCVSRFNGMWAFALWDARTGELFCSRDRLGIKPFYYHIADGTLTFASEIKAILALRAAPAAIDAQQVSAYLLNGYSRSLDTWYQGVRKLAPGSCLTARLTPGKGVEHAIRPYWELPDSDDTLFDPGHALELMRDAVRLRLRSDVPIGFHLSGGLDSSSIVTLAAPQLEKTRTFSGYFTEAAQFDERPYISSVQKMLGTIHADVRITAAGFQQELARLMRIMDHPEAGPGSYNQYALNRLMRDNGVPVSIGGQGGDELFAGYYHYLPSHLRTLARTGKWVRLGKDAFLFGLCGQFLSQAWAALRRRRAGIPAASLLGPDLAAHALGDDYGWSQPGTGIGQRLRSDLLAYIPALLHVEDRTSMAWSIESRLPLLDYRLVEYMMRVDQTEKIRGGRLKDGMHRAMDGLLPATVTNRRDKMGFNSPLGIWFDGPLRPWVQDTLLGPGAMAAGTLLRREALQDILLTHSACKNDLGDLIWKALAVETWLRVGKKGLSL